MKKEYIMIYLLRKTFIKYQQHQQTIIKNIKNILKSEKQQHQKYIRKVNLMYQNHPRLMVIGKYNL